MNHLKIFKEYYFCNMNEKFENYSKEIHMDEFYKENTPIISKISELKNKLFNKKVAVFRKVFITYSDIDPYGEEDWENDLENENISYLLFEGKDLKFDNDYKEKIVCPEFKVEDVVIRKDNFCLRSPLSGYDLRHNPLHFILNLRINYIIKIKENR